MYHTYFTVHFFFFVFNRIRRTYVAYRVEKENDFFKIYFVFIIAARIVIITEVNRLWVGHIDILPSVISGHWLITFRSAVSSVLRFLYATPFVWFISPFTWRDYLLAGNYSSGKDIKYARRWLSSIHTHI